MVMPGRVGYGGLGKRVILGRERESGDHEVVLRDPRPRTTEGQ
jgi:hypothetical protein